MEEVSSSSRSVEYNIKTEIEKRIVVFDEVTIANAVEKTRNVEEKVDEPKAGMLFDSIDELVEFYKIYGKEKGFGVAIRTSKKGSDGKVRYVTVACSHTGKQRVRSSNPLKLRPQSKTDCKAKISVVLCPDGKWMLNSLVLDHNHGLNPDKFRLYRQPSMKRRFESSKSSNPLTAETRGNENMPFQEKNRRYYIDRVGHLKLRDGDATAINNYFMKMQVDNSNFFYLMDLDEDGWLRNVFWADARSRAAFKEFGDVVTFDTTYLVNKYDTPLASFIGADHHGQSILLGCALISSEDTETFTWLFQSWLACMSGCPSAIVTDEDKAMRNAIQIVFPNARHRWCLWHIMKKLPEKMKGYKQNESIKFCMQNVVYDSLTKEEFEESWGRFIEKYELEDNGWLLGLYEERHRWVPTFVKDIFWAGMSTTQRSESMRTFFDGYVNSKTTLRQFVEQYENVLAKKVENENTEEFSSFNSCLPCITHYEMEKQFQSAYTTTKFKEFQQELIGKIYCNLFSCKESSIISQYGVGEDVSTEESHRRVIFDVLFNENTNEVNCNCRLFEYRGILCRHQIVVFIQRAIYRVPGKYILKRWNKTVKRSHTKFRIGYDNWSVKPEADRFERMCNAFHEVAELATNTEDGDAKVMAWIQKIKWDLKEGVEVCGSNKPIFVGTRMPQ